MEKPFELGFQGNNNLDLIDSKQINLQLNKNLSSTEILKRNPALEMISAEYCENFGPYLEKLGLACDPKIIVLSSMHHFYYDAQEMEQVRTVINLKELNRIKHVKGFVNSLFHSLPPACNFIGCFVDNKRFNGFMLRNNTSLPVARRNSEAIENGILSQSPFLNILYSFMDSKPYNNLSKLSVTMLLDGFGFKVLDMTELEGLTYFHAKKVSYLNN